jgi:cytochrome c oxidase subunit I
VTALDDAGRNLRLISVDDVIGPPDITHRGLPRTLSGWLTTTDHKAIGIAYAVTSMIFFAVGGVLADIMRTELARPGLQVVDESTYNSLFTIHGSVMVYLFAVPFGFALANYLIPLQIGAPDLAFPRLNALSYWLYLFGGTIMLLGFLTEGGAADFGWFAYPPLSGPSGSPGLGADLWIVSIILTGTSGTLGAVNVITTVTMLRAPGMTLFRMPILTWNLLLTSFMILVAFPVLTGALMMLEADRRFGAHFFDPTAGGSPLLFQHLFWFFGHPEVYIVALPFFGVVTEIIPVFSRRPVFGYKGLVLATLAISALSTSVWAHHMFVTGQVAAVLRRHVIAHRRTDRGQSVHLDRVDVGRIAQLRAPAAVRDRLPRHVRHRWVDRGDARLADPRLQPLRHLLRRRPLPLRHGRHGRLRSLRGDLLLVAEGHRTDVVEAARDDPLLARDRRVQHDVLLHAPSRP